MRSLLIVSVFFCYSIIIYGQDNSKKFLWSLEYSPALSNLTSYTSYGGNFSKPFGKDIGIRIGHNTFIKTELRLSEKLSLTLGAGLLSTREYTVLDLEGESGVGFTGLDKIESHRMHSFFVIPVGLKYRIGTFTVNPEIGLGINIARPAKQINYLTDGSVITTHHNIVQDVWGYKKLSVPLMLTIGKEIPLGPVKLLLGAKGYYSITKLKHDNTAAFPPTRYYGFGIMTGLKF